MTRWTRLTPLLFACACNVASVREAPNTIAYNTCESSADCAGGICDGESRQCRARSTNFKNILFEITPPADGSAIAGVQYLLTRDNLESDGETELLLDSIAQVTGKARASGRKCSVKFVDDQGAIAKQIDPATSADASVPVRVLLTPSTTSLGLSSPRIGVSAVPDKVVGSWTFAVNVPPGAYDIYLEPTLAQPDASCVVPPQLVRKYQIAAGNIQLGIDLSEPSTFELHVAWPPADGGLDGWTVDMIDPGSGRVISNRVPLVPGGDDYKANLTYSSVTVVGEPSTKQPDPLLRLSPPEGAPESSALPTIVMARSGLAVFDAKSGKLTNFSSLPSAVHVHGQVTSGNTPAPEAATVTLVAKTLPGIAPGVLASLVRTVTTNANGQFDAYLLPGQYTVSTVPQSSLDKGSALAADTRLWTIPSAPFEQAGKVIALGSAFHITGQVLASNGPVATAQVQAVASPQSIQYDALQYTLDNSTNSQLRAAFIPRASAGAVSSKGDFNLWTDPGTFDITVRPNSDTGYPWLVMPNVPVTSITAGLGTLSMPLPVSYRGTVTVPGADGSKPVPSAVVRAYIYLKGDDYTPDATNADSVLQIAETTAATNGAFSLLIPAELNRHPELP